MQFQPQVKQALKQLPPAERVVAVALKNIYDKIKNLYSKQTSQIEGIKYQFMGKFKQIQDNMSTVIQGRKINDSQLAKTDQYFVEEQKQQLKQVLKTVAPIKDYWNDAIKNSMLKNQCDEQDWKILPHLSNISQKVLQKTIQLTFTFKQNSYIQSGSYTRIIQLQNGIPFNFRGDQLKVLKQAVTKGLIFQLFQDTKDQIKIYQKFQIFTFFINDLIPYSLRYFLGEALDQFQGDQDEQDQNQDDDQGQGDDDEENGEKDSEQQGQKGRKKN